MLQAAFFSRNFSWSRKKSQKYHNIIISFQHIGHFTGEHTIWEYFEHVTLSQAVEIYRSDHGRCTQIQSVAPFRSRQDLIAQQASALFRMLPFCSVMVPRSGICRLQCLFFSSSFGFDIFLMCPTIDGAVIFKPIMLEHGSDHWILCVASFNLSLLHSYEAGPSSTLRSNIVNQHLMVTEISTTYYSLRSFAAFVCRSCCVLSMAVLLPTRTALGQCSGYTKIIPQWMIPPAFRTHFGSCPIRCAFTAMNVFLGVSDHSLNLHSSFICFVSLGIYICRCCDKPLSLRSGPVRLAAFTGLPSTHIVVSDETSPSPSTRKFLINSLSL